MATTSLSGSEPDVSVFSFLQVVSLNSELFLNKVFYEVHSDPVSKSFLFRKCIHRIMNDNIAPGNQYLFNLQKYFKDMIV